MNGTMQGVPRTPLARYALEQYNDVQVCREMGWTQADLYAADEEFVWTVMQVLALESEKTDRDRKRPPTPFGPH